MEIYETSIKGLFVKNYDYETTYTKSGGGEFIVNGEYANGEAWINGDWFTYERRGDVVVLEDVDGVERYTFADTEDSWDAFANSVT